MIPFLSSLKGLLLGAALSALCAATVSAVVTHRLDSAALARAQLDFAKREAAAATAANAALRAAIDKTKRMEIAAAAAAQAASDERAKRETALSEAIARGEANDATLANCMRFKLPAGVLRELPR